MNNEEDNNPSVNTVNIIVLFESLIRNITLSFRTSSISVGQWVFVDFELS